MTEYIMVAKIERYASNTWFEVTHVNFSTGEIMIDDRLSITHQTFDLDTGVELKVVEEGNVLDKQ